MTNNLLFGQNEAAVGGINGMTTRPAFTTCDNDEHDSRSKIVTNISFCLNWSVVLTKSVYKIDFQ